MNDRQLTLPLLAIAAALAAACLPTFAEEPPEQGKAHVELGIMGGFFVPDGDLSGKPEKLKESEPLFGVRAAWVFADHWAWFLDGTTSDINTNRTVGGDADIRNLRTGIDYFFSPHWKKLHWYAAAGAGWLDVDLENDEPFQRSFVSASVGQRYALDHHTRLRWELRGDYTLDDDGLGGADLITPSLNIGILWGVGVKRPAVTPATVDDDLDNDGVPDAADPEPDDPDICGDSDGDRCDDCAIGTDDRGPLPDNLPGNDGPDADADGLCDAGDPDLDNDGVPNADDPASFDPTVCGDSDRDGCDDCSVGVDGFGPLPDADPAHDGPDADGDGRCDAGDRCPREAATTPDGCPELIPAPAAPPLVLDGVFFEFDRDVLTPDSLIVLDRVAASLLEHSHVRIEIAGHTDAIGTQAYNYNLSRRRAESVTMYLVFKGVARDRLVPRGYGESRPRADNDTDEGRALNRRVELRRVD